MNADDTTRCNRPVRVLWLMGSDRPKADTISLVRWVRAADRSRLALTVAFMSEPSGHPGLADEMVAPDGSGQTIPDALRQCGAEVAHWPGAGPLSLSAIRQARRFISEHDIDIVVSVYLKPDLFASRIRRRTPAAWIVRAAAIGRFRRARLYAGDWFDRLVYRRADAFLAVSDAVRQDWSARLRRPLADFQVIHNAAPPAPPIDRDDARSASRVIGQGESLVLTVGRLDREKGIELLIDAAANLLADQPKTKWIVLGDGPLRSRLQSRADHAGLSQRLLLAGESDAVWSCLAAADLFVLPSRMEGCPNALLEAAAAGVPIVAMNVGAVPELVRDGVEAMLVQPQSGPAGLAEAIRRLLSDRELAGRLAAAARQRMLDQFNPRMIAERHLAFFHRIARRVCNDRSIV